MIPLESSKEAGLFMWKWLLDPPSAWIDRMARIIVLVIFAISVYFGALLHDMRNNMFMQVNTGEVDLAVQTIAAANAGYPFYMIDPTLTSPTIEQFRPYLMDGDYGISILLSSTYSVAHAIGNIDFTLSLESIYYILYVYFLIAAVLILLPGTPLPLALGGVFSLMIAILVEPIDFTVGRYWGTPLTVLLLAVLLCLSVLPHRTLQTYGSIGGLSILIGYGQFIRQESSIVVWSCIIVIVGVFILNNALVWTLPRYAELRKAVTELSRRLGVVVIILGVAMNLWPYLLQGVYANAWHMSYFETPVPNHGSGHNLYISLGNVPNDYNISWQDSTGDSHYALFQTETGYVDPAYQAGQGAEWFNIVRQSPWLLNAVLFHNASYTIDRFVNVRHHGIASLILFASALLMLIGTLILTMFRAKLPAVFLITAWLGMVAGSLAAPLIVQPIGFLQGVVTSLLSTVMILPIGVLVAYSLSDATIPQNENKQILVNRFSRTLVGIWVALVGTGIAVWAIYTIVQANAHQSELTRLSTANPVDQLVEKGFRYDWLFNGMELNTQAALVKQIQQPDPRVVTYLPSPAGRDKSNGFDVAAVVLSGSQIHILTHIGELYPLLRRTDTLVDWDFLRVCQPCVDNAQNTVNGNEFNLGVGMPIFADNEHYRLFSIALPVADQSILPECLNIRVMRETYDEDKYSSQLLFESRVCR